LEKVCADEYHNFLDTSPNTENAFRGGYVPIDTRKPKTYMPEIKPFGKIEVQRNEITLNEIPNTKKTCIGYGSK